MFLLSQLFLCDICQNIITEERNDQYEDNDWEYLLPHAPTHSVYKTEVPDPSSPSVLHTSHPPHGTKTDLSPIEDSASWQLTDATAEGLTQNDAEWSALYINAA